MKADRFTRKIIEKFGTNDVYEIAEKNGVSILYENWYPVTIGEFERKTKTIRINLRVLGNKGNNEILERTIIAHELGHFFAGEFHFNKKDEEIFAHEFAENLISSAENIN
jgi:Zn-dependent peptidase ImmA (M78 family)